ncbi:hypothetical protein JCM10212_003001 [Sporobolomyces blumeae]
MSTLSQSQREALAQFQSITASQDEAAAVEALRSVGWNLEVAISQVYDGGAPSSSSRTTFPPPRRDDPPTSATVDDALLPSPPSSSSSPRQRTGHGARAMNGTGIGTGVVGLYYLRQALAVPVAILSWPVSILYNVGALILGLLARLVGFRISTSSLHARNPFKAPRRPRTILSPHAASERWIENLERLTSLPRMHRPRSADSLGRDEAGQTSSATMVGSSTGIARRVHSDASETTSGETLPDFFVGGYEEALRKARDDMRVLMVVLSCEEHEQDEAFKRQVLADQELVKALKDENVFVWGGDVMERDAYQVGRMLAYTALPFVAFISLQPTPTSSTARPSSSSSSPRLSLLSRLEPTRSSPVLTASTIHTHLVSHVVPKTGPYLARLRSDKQRRERDRFAREERERRETEVARRDEARILEMRRQDEVRKREERERDERRREEERDFERRELEARKARAWRQARRERFDAEDEATGSGAVRVVVRLGNGQRVMRRFEGSDSVVSVYEWVECQLGRDDDDDAKTNGRTSDVSIEGYEQKFAFTLATTFPRQVIELPRSMYVPKDAYPKRSRRGSLQSASSPTTRTARSSFSSAVSDSSAVSAASLAREADTVEQAFSGLGKDVSLVVDGLEQRRRISMSSREGASDEEDDEEEEEGQEEGGWDV